MSGKISKSSGQATNELVLNTVKSLAANGPLKILDLGCGSGAMLESIAEYYRDCGWEPADYLLGVDIKLDNYKAAVPSQAVDLNHPLAESLGKFDLIISIEVLEHVRRPYILIEEIYSFLNENGTFLFTVPNPGNMNSRIKYLAYGHYQMFFGPSARPEDAHHLCGHINPLPVQYWDYGLRYAGFSHIENLVDRRKKSAIIWTLLFCPILLIGFFLMHRAQKKYSEDVHRENQRALSRVNHIDTLTGRSLVFLCQK